VAWFITDLELLYICHVCNEETKTKKL